MFCLVIFSVENSIQNIRNQTGADLQFDASPSPVPGMKILLVRGDSSEIQAAISLVSQKTGNKVGTTLHTKDSR